MPELDYAVLCDYVRTESSGGVAHIVAAGIDTIHTAQVPTGINFGVAVRVKFSRSECQRPHRLELIVMAMDGDRLGTVNGSVVPEWPEGQPEHWKVGAAAGLNFGFAIEAFGLYQIDLLVNDSLAKSMPFRVVQRGGNG